MAQRYRRMYELTDVELIQGLVDVGDRAEYLFLADIVAVKTEKGRHNGTAGERRCVGQDTPIDREDFLLSPASRAGILYITSS